MISGAISNVGSFFSSRVGVAVGIGALALGVCLVAYRFFSMRAQKTTADVTVTFSDGKVRHFKFNCIKFFTEKDKYNVGSNNENLSAMITNAVSNAVKQGTLGSDSNQEFLQFPSSDPSSFGRSIVQGISHLNNITQMGEDRSCQIEVVYR